MLFFSYIYYEIAVLQASSVKGVSFRRKGLDPVEFINQ